MKEQKEPRDISERTFSFALDTVRICENLIAKAGVMQHIDALNAVSTLKVTCVFISVLKFCCL